MTGVSGFLGPVAACPELAPCWNLTVTAIGAGPEGDRT